MGGLTIKVDDLENDLAKLATAKDEAIQTAEYQIRENRRLNGCCADLSRQVFKVKIFLIVLCECYVIQSWNFQEENKNKILTGSNNILLNNKNQIIHSFSRVSKIFLLYRFVIYSENLKLPEVTQYLFTTFRII